MKVIEVVQGLGGGGAERSLIDRLAFCPSDVETKIVNFMPQLDQIQIDPNIPSVTAGNAPRATFRSLCRDVARFKPDVVIMRTPRHLISLAPRLKRQFPQVKVVFEAHSEVASPRIPLLSAVLALALRFCGRFADLHIAASSRVAGAQQCYGARSTVVHYFGTSVHPDSSGNLPPVAGLRFLHLGRLVRGKRTLELLEAVLLVAEEFRSSGSVLTIVGDGPERARVEALVQQVSAGDIVEIVGKVDDPDSVLASSDVLVISSLQEGLPLVAFEAIRMGLRVITTPAGGTREILRDEDILCSDFSVETMSHAIRQMLASGKASDSDRRRRVIESSAYDACQTVPKYYEVIRNLVRERRVMEVLSGPIEGGIPTTIRTRLRNAPDGIDTVILCPPTSWIEGRASAESFPCKVLQYKSFKAALCGIAFELRQFRPRCVIAHTERDLWWAILGRAISRVKSRIVFVVHSDRFECRPAFRFLMPLALYVARPFITHVIAVSGDTKLGEAGRCFPQAIVRLQPPALSKPEIRYNSRNGPTFLMAKRLVASKGIGNVVEGVVLSQSVLRAANARLVVAGDGPERLALEARVREAGVSDLIGFMGWVTNLNSLFAESDYFLQPSINEGAGMSLVEALTAGLLVASSPRGLARDVLPGDEGSTLFPTVPNASEWAEWLVTAVATPRPSIEQREQRIERFRRIFDPEILTKEFYAAFLRSGV